MKYNYVKAGEIFARFFNLCVSPWDLTNTEKQKNRREFMRMLTRKFEEGLKPYIEFIEEERNSVCIMDDGKSRMVDFDMMKEYNDLIADIKGFTN